MDITFFDTNNRPYKIVGKIVQFRITTNRNGAEGLQVEWQTTEGQAIGWYSRFQSYRIVVTYKGGWVWVGRLDDLTLLDRGLRAVSIGIFKTFGDIPYTALWSDTSVAKWRPYLATDWSLVNDKPYSLDQQNRLYVTLTKNASYASSADVGGFVYQIPLGGAGNRNIVGLSFDLVLNLPTNWKCELRISDDLAQNGAAIVDAITSSGTALTLARHHTFTAKACLALYIFNATGITYTNTAETGVYYARITNLRIVTSITNLINTTLSANVSAGATSFTVANAARIQGGTRLTLNSGASPSESVVVAGVSGSTINLATALVSGYSSGVSVRSLFVDSAEIYRDCVSIANTTNPSFVSSVHTIPDTGLDLTDCVYLDAAMTSVIQGIADLGNNALQRYDAQIVEPNIATLQVQGTGRTWYVDIADLELQRTATTLANSAYAVYDNKRTATATDTTSVAKYGVTKRIAYAANTTSPTSAALQRDLALQQQANPKPKATITIKAVRNAAGTKIPLWLVAGGDTIIIRNIPAVLANGTSFGIGHTDYDAISNTLSVEPYEPPSTLEYLLTRAAQGV